MLMRATVLSSALTLAALAFSARAQDHSGTASGYSGYEKREIKSLSQDDISQIRSGQGWGLALPAELSGRPGPAHLLELSDQLGLTAEQEATIRELHTAMKADAIAAGENFIAAERALSDAFARPYLEESELQMLVDEAAMARAALRQVHLKQHLATPDLLTSEQITHYNRLRGYDSDPCTNVPEGHNAEMWRKHNGCE